MIKIFTSAEKEKITLAWVVLSLAFRSLRSLYLYSLCSFFGDTMKLNTKRKYSNKNYVNHWDRPIWKIIRAYRLYLDGYTCNACGKKFQTKDLRAHHTSYNYLNTEKEILSLRTVCRWCHSKIHNKHIKP